MDATTVRESLRHGAFVATVAVLALFTNLGGPRLWDRDEPRNAGCAREMLQRGDWVTPVFNGELRGHKPVLLYWLIMSAYGVLGVNEFAARFWSAALSVGTVVCTCLIGRHLFRPQVGVWAGLVLATCLMFDVAGRAATPDAALVFFSTLALTTFVLGTLPANHAPIHERLWSEANQRPAVALTPGRWWVWGLVYAAMGLAVLAKGPVGFILPAAIIGLVMLTVSRPDPGQLTEGGSLRRTLVQVWEDLHPRRVVRVVWCMRPWLAIAVICLISMPWYVAVGLRTDGRFLYEFLWEHHFGRATAAMEGHAGGFWYYPVAILVGSFPWSVFAVPVLLDILGRLRGRQPWTAGHTVSICWLGVYVGAFSLARTKLPSYVTPCYPGLALVVGCFVDGWTRRTQLSPNLWPRLALGVFALIGCAIIVAVPVAARQLLPGEEWLALIGLVPLAGGLAGLWCAWRGANRRAAIAFACAAVVWTMSLFSIAAQRVDQHQQNVALLASARRQAGDVSWAAFGCLEPSWVFYNGRPIEQLALSEGPNLSRRWVEIDRRWVSQPWLTVREILHQKPDAAIITSDEFAESLRAQLPYEYRVVASAGYFLKKHQLLVFARDPRSAMPAARVSAREQRAGR